MTKKGIEKNQNLRVLVLEDIPTDAELIIRELEVGNFIIEAKIVDDEVGFRKGISDFRPEVIISDYSLPTITGLEALSIAIQECPEIPFVFVTGTIGEEIAAETILSGAAGLVLKSRLNTLPTTLKNLYKDEAKWIHSRYKNASERINNRIAKNERVLSRLDDFIKNSRSGELSNDIVNDIRIMVDNMKDITTKLNDRQQEE